MRVAEHVLYLVFNEGYTASSGPDLQRTELADEAIRLTRLLRRLPPGDDEVAGLLALMLLTDARRAARTGEGGALVPLAEQDRSLWDRAAIEEGVALVEEALAQRAGRALPAAGSDRGRPCGGARPRRRPTGRRSWPCTGCWSGSPPARPSR